MKNKHYLLFLNLVAMTSLVQCTNPSSTMKLTYGSYITTSDITNSDAKQISHSDLSLKMSKDSTTNTENFLLVMADPSGSCACWPTFKTVLKQFIKEYHYNVYFIDFKEFNGKEDFGLTFKTGYVSLAVVKGQKILRQYPDCHVFETAKDLKAELDKYVVAPELYYVDEDYLNHEFKNGNDVVVQYVRSGCGDCNYVNPNVIWPYANENTFKIKMFVIDLQDLYDKQVEEKAAGMERTSYQEFKNEHNLSTLRTTDFGYENGVVPTIQYYKKGQLKDATVYFNDEVGKVDGKFYITNSFYDEHRESHLSYLPLRGTRVLKGMELKEEEVGIFPLDNGENYYYWKQTYADKYHRPLLEAFLDMYVK